MAGCCDPMVGDNRKSIFWKRFNKAPPLCIEVNTMVQVAQGKVTCCAATRIGEELSQIHNSHLLHACQNRHCLHVSIVIEFFFYFASHRPQHRSCCPLHQVPIQAQSRICYLRTKSISDQDITDPPHNLVDTFSLPQ